MSYSRKEDTKNSSIDSLSALGVKARKGNLAKKRKKLENITQHCGDKETRSSSSYKICHCKSKQNYSSTSPLHSSSKTNNLFHLRILKNNCNHLFNSYVTYCC